jgi:P-type Ca2+ transporter type 2C
LDSSKLNFEEEDIWQHVKNFIHYRDPLRKGVAEAVNECQRAGIHVRMITGDSVETAIKIAEQCHIYPSTGHSLVLTGDEFFNKV